MYPIDKLKNILNEVYLIYLKNENKKNAENKFSISHPPKHINFDYSTNIAFIISKKINKDALEIAKNICNYIKNKYINFIENIETAGNGFINIKIKKEEYIACFNNLPAKNINIGKSKKIIIEYSSPNVAKPMHIGHLRATVLGDFLANLYSFTGYKVIRWNHLGDWGTQFGKLIYAYKKWGDKNKIKKNPINELLKLYVKFHKESENNKEIIDFARKEFKKLENNDKKNKKILNWFLKESLKEYNKIYKFLGIKFNKITGESFYSKYNKKIIKLLIDKKIAEISNGALIVNLNNDNLPPALVQKSDKSTLYITRDLSSLYYRIKKYNPEEILYVVGDTQILHFKQLFSIYKKIWNKNTKLIHIYFGIVLDKNGNKLATREGNIITAQFIIKRILEESERKIKISDKNKKNIKKISTIISAGAIKYSLLKEDRKSPIKFDPEKAVSLKGNSSVYIQYTYARLSSIIRKSKLKFNKIKINLLKNLNDEEIELIKIMSEFKSIIKLSLKTQSSHNISEFLFNLSNYVNSYYEKTKILDYDNKEKMIARLKLIDKVRNNIKIGLKIMGIDTPENI